MTIAELKDPKVLRVTRTKCLRSLLFHIQYFFLQQYGKKFIVSEHHRVLCQALEDVLLGKCLRLGISLPPRYGKTEIAVKGFISHGLALNPASKWIHLSYGDDIALDNSEAIKDLVESEAYQDVFPGINVKWDSKSKKKWYTNHGGGILARAAAGQVTGFGAGTVDEEADYDAFLNGYEDLIGTPDLLETKLNFGGAIIIDDPIKPEDADQETIRERVNSRYDSTIRTRVNSRTTPIIVIMHRLHPNDLIGYLKRKDEADDWTFITMPALVRDADGEEGEIDGKVDKWKALWEFKHTVPELLKLAKANEVVFGRQYQQDPSPKHGLLFPIGLLNFYNPADVDLTDPDFTLVAGDPAGDGGDDFAAGKYKLLGNKIYVPSILYNTDGTDLNEVAVGKMVMNGKVSEVWIEGVFGWKETASRIREDVQAKGYTGEFRIVKPRTSKEARILNRASFVRNNFWFRSDWEQLPQYAKYMRNIISYLRIQEPGKKNKHDDGVDVNEMAANFFEKTMPHLW